MASTLGATAPGRWARKYETIYILRPNVEPDAADKVAKRVGEVIQRQDGTLTKVDNWGKRKLAYHIDGHSRGIFVQLNYMGYSDLVAELERNLRMLDDVVRFMTIQDEDMVDPRTVEVDPEEVKFLRIEPTEDDDEELTVEQRLGLVPAESSEDREKKEKKPASDEEE